MDYAHLIELITEALARLDESHGLTGIERACVLSQGIQAEAERLSLGLILSYDSLKHVEPDGIAYVKRLQMRDPAFPEIPAATAMYQISRSKQVITPERVAFLPVDYGDLPKIHESMRLNLRAWVRHLERKARPAIDEPEPTTLKKAVETVDRLHLRKMLTEEYPSLTDSTATKAVTRALKEDSQSPIFSLPPQSIPKNKAQEWFYWEREKRSTHGYRRVNSATR